MKMRLWRAIQTVRAVYRRAPSWARAAWATGWQTFAGVVLLGVLGLLDQIREYVAGGPSPDWGQFGRDLADASLVLTAALVTAVWRRARPAEAAYADRGDRG